MAENPIVPFDEVGWRKIECHGRSQLDVNAVLTAIDITTSEAIAIGIGAALISAPLSPVLGVFIGAAATLVTPLPGNDSFGGANATVPTNGAVTLRFRGPDGAADLPIEGSTASVPGAARTDCPDPVAEPPMVSTPTPEEQAEQLFGPLENALQLSRQASYESGLGGEAAESQIADVRRTLGGAVLKLGEIAATLAVETANEPDSLKIGAELIASGRSAATEGNWDDALAHYRTAFASAAPPDQAQESEIPSELPQRVALLPEFVATTPLRTIAVEGYVTGLSPGAAVEDVELGQLPISINVGPPVVRHERTFGFAVEIGDVALDAGTPLEVTLPVTARLTTGEVAQGGLTLIIYPRPQDGSEER